MTAVPPPVPPGPSGPNWQLLAQARLQADSAMYAAHRVAALMVDFERVVADRDRWQREAESWKQTADLMRAEIDELRDAKVPTDA